MKITNVKILDTGYVGTGIRGEQIQLAVADRAGYDGSSDVVSFTLKPSNITIGAQVKVEGKPIIDTLTDVSTTLVSTQNRVLQVSAIIQKSITTSGYDVNDVHQFFRLDRTRGLKLLYVDATGDTKKTIIEALGAVNTDNKDLFASETPSETNGTVSTTTPYLVGRVKDLSLTDSSVNTKYWSVRFNFEISG